jgi:drug/metabolite transporter (DMT)-like permease
MSLDSSPLAILALVFSGMFTAAAIWTILAFHKKKLTAQYWLSLLLAAVPASILSAARIVEGDEVDLNSSADITLVVSVAVFLAGCLLKLCEGRLRKQSGR